MATAAFKAPVGSYTFTTSPRALDSRSKPAPQFHPQNIMFDKRVRRGASLAAKPQQVFYYFVTCLNGSPCRLQLLEPPVLLLLSAPGSWPYRGHKVLVTEIILLLFLEENVRIIQLSFIILNVLFLLLLAMCRH